MFCEGDIQVRGFQDPSQTLFGVVIDLVNVSISRNVSIGRREARTRLDNE